MNMILFLMVRLPEGSQFSSFSLPFLVVFMVPRWSTFLTVDGNVIADDKFYMLNICSSFRSLPIFLMESWSNYDDDENDDNYDENDDDDDYDDGDDNNYVTKLTNRCQAGR